ncbi:MAG: hypothetical protein FJZ01_15970 [Candidatus Sericytochromatia bacterium]|nr:hypothetical protein [Candidatus Tanganyikabacteria bacterium]
MTTETRTLCQITAVVNKAFTGAVLDALRAADVRNIHQVAGRRSVLEERRGFLAALSTDLVLAEEPADVLFFFVDPEYEDQALSVVARAAQLQVPGHGSVFSEQCEIGKAHGLYAEKRALIYSGDLVPMFRDMVRLTCIVQRGQGDHLARVALKAGAVPVTTYGTGTGLRDKLGLLRITIPAEKEVLTLCVAGYDADTVIELLVEAGKLDQPGRGFVYQTAVHKGLLDTRISRGTSAQAASVEQIITALDNLQGGMEWRRSGQAARTGKRRSFFGGTDLSLVCDEGHGLDLVDAAMRAGAAGATIERLKVVVRAKESGKVLTPARVTCRMIVPPDKAGEIIDAMEAAGAFSDQAQGLVGSKPVPKAFTYIPAKA